MPWVRIDDGFSEHPKWAGAAALDVQWFLYALCYCNRNLTDGFIPSSVALRLTPSKPQPAIERLVRSGVIDVELGGYRIHDYLTYQPSKESIEAERERAKSRQKRFRSRERNAVTNAVTPPLVTPLSRDRHAGPDPDPDPKKKERTERTPPDGGASVEFLTFWETYPRKKSRVDATKAWRQVKPINGTVELIVADITRRLQTGEWSTAKDRLAYIPYPATYLRGRQWQDEPEDLSRPGASGRGPSAQSVTLAREQIRKLGGCPHGTGHSYADCVAELATKYEGRS